MNSTHSRTLTRELAPDLPLRAFDWHWVRPPSSPQAYESNFLNLTSAHHAMSQSKGIAIHLAVKFSGLPRPKQMTRIRPKLEAEYADDCLSAVLADTLT